MSGSGVVKKEFIKPEQVKKEEELDIQNVQVQKQESYDKKEKTNFKKWTLEEQEIYVKFIDDNREFFQNSFSRRSKHVFKEASHLLAKRNPTQCRTHHQKVLLKFGSDIDKLIEKAYEQIRKKQQKMRYRLDVQAKEKNINKNNQDKKQLENMIRYRVTQRNKMGIDCIVDLDYIQPW